MMLQPAGNSGRMELARQPNAGRFLFQSADAFSIEYLLGKVPRITGLTSRRLSSSIGRDTGHFAFPVKELTS